MLPSRRISLEVELAVGVSVGLVMALAFGRGGAVDPWLALGVGLGALPAFLLERFWRR